MPDLGEQTARVLEGGLPPLPPELEPGQTVAVALWRGERYGAVLFVRLWKNGNVDSDCAISQRAADGSWDVPSGWGGSGWIDDPLVRSRDGWYGDPVAWLGSYGIGLRADETDSDAWPLAPGGLELEDKVVGTSVTTSPGFHPEPWVGLDVRALLGAASEQVAAIEVEHAGRTWKVPIESPTGAFIVGLESTGPATLRALGHDGHPLADADGVTDHVG